MNENSNSKRVRLIWALGVFLGVFVFHTFAFPPFDVAELAYLLPIPVLLWLFYQTPSRRLFLICAGGGFWLSWLVLIFWLRHVTWVGWFGLASIVALFPTGWALLAWWQVPQFKDRGLGLRLLGILSLCAIWVLLEFVRTFFLSGFPWLPLAASQWKRPLMLQVATWTGSYGVSFIILMVGMTIAFYLRHLFQGKRKRWFSPCPEFLIGMTVWLFATFVIFQLKYQLVERQPFFDVALIQPYIPQDQKWDHSKAEEITLEIEKQLMFQKHIGADIAMLPEAVLPYPLVGDAGMRKWAERLATEFDGPLLLGALAAEGDTKADDPWYNGFMIVYPDTGLAQTYYRKRQRVPFGEFIPFRKALFFLEKFVPIGGDIFPGKTAEPLRLKTEKGSIPIGVLICYEDIFPGLAVDSVKAGARLLCVVTNDAWYGEEGAAYQHAAHSVLRAVETMRPVIRVGNGGWSGWIDEYGNVREVLESAEGSVYVRGGEVVTVTYDPNTYQKHSFFVKYGNWFVGVCAALVIIFLILVRRTPGALSEEEEWEKVGEMKIRPPE